MRRSRLPRLRKPLWHLDAALATDTADTARVALQRAEAYGTSWTAVMDPYAPGSAHICSRFPRLPFIQQAVASYSGRRVGVKDEFVVLPSPNWPRVVWCERNRPPRSGWPRSAPVRGARSVGVGLGRSRSVRPSAYGPPIQRGELLQREVLHLHLGHELPVLYRNRVGEETQVLVLAADDEIVGRGAFAPRGVGRGTVAGEVPRTDGDRTVQEDLDGVRRTRDGYVGVLGGGRTVDAREGEDRRERERAHPLPEASSRRRLHHVNLWLMS